MADSAPALGVSATLECLEGLRLLVSDYAKVMADGKVDMTDLKVLSDIFSQFSALSQAMKDASQVLPELKDLDAGEVAQVAAKAYSIVEAFKAPPQP